MTRATTYRRGKYFPRLDTLETRWQPGSLLTQGLDLSLVGAGLDPHFPNTADAGQVPAPPRPLAPDLNLMHSSTSLSGGTVTVEPYQVTHHAAESTSSLTLATSSFTDAEFVGQGLAAAAQVHRSMVQGTPAVATTDAGAVQSVSQNGQGPQTTQGGLTVSVQTAQPPVPVTAAEEEPLDLQAGQLLEKEPGSVSQANDHPPPITGTNASYFGLGIGGVGTTALYHVVASPNGRTLYAVGWEPSLSWPGKLDLVVATMTSNCQNLLSVWAYRAAAGGNAKGYSIDLDSNGNVLVAGEANDFYGLPQGVVASVSPVTGQLNWQRYVHYGNRSNFYGVKVRFDANRGFNAVYFTGVANSRLVAGETDEAGNTAFFRGYKLFSNGNRIGSEGHAVDVDPTTGNIDIAGVVRTARGTKYASYFQVTPGGVFNGGNYFLSPGSMNGVSVDQVTGDAFYAGSYQNPNTGTASTLVVDIAANGVLAYGFYWTFTVGNVPYNSPAYDNKIDALDNMYMELTIDDNSHRPNTHGQLFFEVDNTGGNSVDFGDGRVNGSNDDYGYGIATDGNGNIWLVGKTNSPDFTTNGFQTAYDGGRWDGWVASFTQP